MNKLLPETILIKHPIVNFVNHYYGKDEIGWRFWPSEIMLIFPVLNFNSKYEIDSGSGFSGVRIRQSASNYYYDKYATRRKINSHLIVPDDTVSNDETTSSMLYISTARYTLNGKLLNGQLGYSSFVFCATYYKSGLVYADRLAMDTMAGSGSGIEEAFYDPPSEPVLTLSARRILKG